MECRRLQLSNFCQHRDLVVNFVPGLNGIIGANGSGKSNVINAIRYVITGVNYNSGNKTENINTEAGKKEPAKVVLEFGHSGHSYVIERNLRAVKPDATLYRDGELLLSGNTPVTVEMLNILGISLDLFDDVVVAGQDDLYGFISHKPSQRAEKFQTLFQTKVAEQVHDSAGSWLKNNMVEDHSSNLQTAIETLNRLNRDLSESMSLKAQLPNEASLQKLVNEAKTASEYSGRLVTVRQFLTNARQALELLQASADYASLTERAWQELQASEAMVTYWQGKQAEASVMIGMARAAEQRNSQREQIRQQYSTAFAAAATLPDVSDTDLKASQSTRDIANSDYSLNLQLGRTLQSQVASLAVDGKCPTCGHVSEDTAKLREALLAQLEAAKIADLSLKRELDQAELNLRNTKAAKIARDANANLLANLQTQISHLGEQYEVVLNVTEAAEVPAALYAEQKNQQFCHNAWAQANGQYQRQVADIAAYTQSADNLKKELEQLEANPAIFTEDPAAVQAANNQLLSHAQLSAAINLRAHEIELVNVQISGWQTLCDFEYKGRQWRTVMEGVRQFTHKTGLPSMVASRNMKVIQDEMNRFLSVFSADFRTFSEDGVTFTARFFDGKEQPVERLSGGQKVITALSFRLAVNRLLASNVGLLILDEPTVYQDEHNIQAFAPTLERLRQFSATKGLQCIIVTHEKELAGHCDYVIQLR